MNRVGNKWTEEEEQRMIEGFQQGRTMERMAKDHQRTPKAMEMRRDHLLRKLSSHSNVSELSQLFRMTTDQVQVILSSTPPPPSSATTGKGGGVAPFEPALQEMLQRLVRMETLMEKMYKRIKSLEK